MEELINRIDKYLYIQEKKDKIEESLHFSSDVKDIIEAVKASNETDKKRILSMLDENTRKEVKKLIEGGIL